MGYDSGATQWRKHPEANNNRSNLTPFLVPFELVAMAHQAGATTLTQQSENFGYSAVRLRRIAKLQFGIINPVELVRMPL